MSDNEDQDEFYKLDNEVPEVEENIARMPSGTSGVKTLREDMKEEDLENVEDQVNHTNRALDQLNEMKDGENVENAILTQEEQDLHLLERENEGENGANDTENQDPLIEEEEIKRNPEEYINGDEEVLPDEGKGRVSVAEEEQNVPLEEQHLSEPGNTREDIGAIEREDRPATDPEHAHEANNQKKSPQDYIEQPEQIEEPEQFEEPEEIDPREEFERRREYNEKLNEEININLIELNKLRRE